jgi:hypothetical protein
LFVSQRIFRTPMSRRICAPMPKPRKMLERGDRNPVDGGVAEPASGSEKRSSPRPGRRR